VARLIAERDELRAALRDALRYLVTPRGVPGAGKGRTERQQAALEPVNRPSRTEVADDACGDCELSEARELKGP
jgi:hypothetical protein